MIDAGLKRSFEEDGVVCVRGVVPGDLVERLRAGLAERMQAPSRLAQDFTEPGAGRFFSDMHLWRSVDACTEVALRSGVPELVGELLGARTLRLLYDQAIVKEPRTRSATPWHHDLPFWPVTGDKIASCWIALDTVDEETGGVFYARGSHRSAKLYRPTQPDNERTRRMKNMDLPQCPNLFDDPEADLVTWDMEPGDVLVFHALTCHGARANRSAERVRRAFVPRYVGEDARFVSGLHALEFPEAPGLADGAPLDTPDFPVAWQAPELETVA